MLRVETVAGCGFLNPTSFAPVESDVPKILPGEIRRFFALPGFPPLDIENARRLTAVNILQFDVVNRGP